MLSIATVLPPREGFNSEEAGAIALFVSHYMRVDKDSVDSTVFGGWVGTPYKDLKYRSVNIPRLRLTSKSIAYANEVSQLLLHGGYSLVEVHNRPAIALAIKQRCPELKVSLFLHNDPVTMKELRSSKFLQSCARELDSFVAVSHFVADSLSNMCPEAKSKTKVVYNALDDSWFDRPESTIDLDDLPINVTYIGRIVPEKGVLEIAQAFKQLSLSSKRFKFSFIGSSGFLKTASETDFEREVKRLVEASSSSVEYLGARNNDFIRQHLQKSDLVIVPSKVKEAFGRVLLEAMSQNNACIISDAGALPEVGGEAVIVLETVSAEAIISTIEKLTANKSCITDLKRKAIERAKEFSVQACYPDLAKYRFELLNGENHWKA
ncbi:Spore coat protein SA [Marinobacterium sp. xm-d-579]|jgi:glycosyltransferase involved in cell wall biosynthesis|uniref:glycosyltransferase family 4 protein n=1 Tax=Marinobacterium sp. xm-d-579 TaxID=2497734 RepID=UPI00156A1DDA|nr:glycosyltransferase family 4 protein [Marinobacterium sp. xm-d-579]NRP35938.1 Spore coat protein SA [Marinobacterium sp. xm-d-579]